MIGIEVVVGSSGRVESVRRKRSTLKNADLAACLTRTLRESAFPEAAGRSTANVEIHVAPGDPS
jgi:hypothetical protein